MSQPSTPPSCPDCADVVDRSDVPHVIRPCATCGRELHIVEPGEHGRGIRINAGDKFVIPGGWLKFAFNPLKSTGSFTVHGLEFFAKQVFLEGLPAKDETYVQEAAALEGRMDEIVNSSPLISPLDINVESDNPKISDIVHQNQNTPLFWAFWTGQFLAISRDARARGDVNIASWATACAERCRSMLIYKEHLEEVIWMGHSAKRIIDVLKIWDAHREEDNEAFWQSVLSEHSYVLSQIFAVPVIFIRERAYVGGMVLDQSNAKFVDYLYTTESCRDAILIEIKTPKTKLLGARYRGVYPPSKELSGASVQVLNYRLELTRNLQNVTAGTPHKLEAYRPRCILLAGNAAAELTDGDKIKSFELYRASSEVEIITYDELFGKTAKLAELFSLKRTGQPAKAPPP